MSEDIMPAGGHRRKADPAYAKKIREGGKKAQQIAKDTHALHEKEDVPLAEEELLKDLANFNNNHLKNSKK